MRRPIPLAVAATLMLLLAGCGSGGGDARPGETVSATATATGVDDAMETLTPVEEYEVDGNGEIVGATTSSPDPEQLAAESSEAAVASKSEAAESRAAASQAAQDALENKAAKIAYDGESDASTLKEMCEESMLGYDDLTSLSEDQLKEVKGALVLCPKHKDRTKIDKQVKNSETILAQEKNGTRFRDGTYRVGKDIKAGTYVSTGYPEKDLDDEDEDGSMENCYWERTNAAGDIIDNHFGTHAFRVQVTIQPSDYSFDTENCGEWVRQ